MSSTAAASGFVVFLLSVQVVQSQDDWGVTYTSTKICAPTGSTVEMSCNYKYPSISYPSITVIKTFWFTQMSHIEPVDLTTDSEYKDRVQYNCTNNFCTLRISDLRKSDSAEYKFRFTTIRPDGKFSSSSGVNLTVTDLQVWEQSKYKWLQCNASCRPPYNSYLWYQNGQEMLDKNSFYLDTFDNQHSYSCAFKGYVDYPSPSECVKGQTCNRLTYTDRSICASKGSSVNISCTYNKYNHRDASTFWFRKNPAPPEDLLVNSQYAGRAEVETVRGRSTLTFSDLTESDSAEYHFKFKTPNSDWSSLPGTTLTVTELQVQVIRAHPYGTIIELGCYNTCSQAGPSSLVWIKNGEEFRDEREIYFYTGRLNPGDVISCALNGYEQFPSPSVYAPKLPSLSVSPSEIVEGSSVTLTCSSDANPAANCTWFKKNGNLNQNPTSRETQLVLKSIRSSDSGEYFCTAENQLGRTSEYIVIDVKYPPRLPSVSVSPSEIVEGSSVNLTCSGDANPGASYTWYKENEDSPKASGQIFTITDFRAEHSGNYYCKAQNKLGHKNSIIRLSLPTGQRTIVIVVIIVTLVVLILIVALLLRRCMRKKKTLDSSSEPNDPMHSLDSGPECQSVSALKSTAAKTEDKEEQEDLM